MPERYVGRAEIAERLGLSERRITQLVKDGRLQDGTPFPSRVDGNERSFPWDRCFEWYIRFKQEEALRRSAAPKETTSQIEADRRKAVADAEMAELRLFRMRAELVPRQVFREELLRAFTAASARLDSAPGEYAARMVGLPDIGAATERLRDLVRRVKEELQGAGEIPVDDGPEPPPDVGDDEVRPAA